MSRTAFLASLTVGALVHLVVSDDLRADAWIDSVSAHRIVVRSDGKTTVLDGSGYRAKSLVVRIEPALADGAPSSAAVWNAARAEVVATNRAALLARLAA